MESFVFGNEFWVFLSDFMAFFRIQNLWVFDEVRNENIWNFIQFLSQTILSQSQFIIITVNLTEKSLLNSLHGFYGIVSRALEKGVPLPKVPSGMKSLL